MVTGSASVPNELSVPFTKRSLAVVPEATPLIITSVLERMVSVAAVGTVTSLVMSTTPLHTVLTACVPPAVTTGTLVMVTSDRVACNAPTVAVRLKSPPPLNVTSMLPRPLRIGTRLVESVTPASVLKSASPSHRLVLRIPAGVSTSTRTSAGTPGR